MKPRLVSVATVIAAVLCGGCDRPAPKLSASVWRPCRLPNISQPVSCTTIDVPERRDKPAGRIVKLHVAKVGAIGATPRPDPLYFIAGGPGQAATRVAFQALSALQRVRRNRDLVFIDVRGTGDSQPLNCKLRDDDEAAAVFDDQLAPSRVRDCAAQFVDRDLSTYRTTTIADDLDAVASALGHDRVNVYGISYGTRVVLQWMRTHPERLRAVVLDGVVPPDMVLFARFGRDAQAAFDALAGDCAANPACKRAFGDVNSALSALLNGAALPDHVTVADARTGAPTRLRMRRSGLALALRSLLYSPDLQALLPLAVRDARAGRFGPLAAQAAALAVGAADSTSLGLLFAVACAEDVPLLTAAGLASEASESLIGPTVALRMQDVCAAWPTSAGTPLDRTPVRSDIPTLLLSGRLDPVTPAHWARTAAATLSRHQHVVVPGAAHGTFATGCVPRLLGEFIDDADPKALDAACVQQTARTPIFVNRAGPTP